MQRKAPGDVRGLPPEGLGQVVMPVRRLGEGWLQGVAPGGPGAGTPWIMGWGSYGFWGARPTTPEVYTLWAALAKYATIGYWPDERVEVKREQADPCPLRGGRPSGRGDDQP